MWIGSYPADELGREVAAAGHPRKLFTNPATSGVFYCLLKNGKAETAYCSGQQQHRLLVWLLAIYSGSLESVAP